MTMNPNMHSPIQTSHTEEDFPAMPPLCNSGAKRQRSHTSTRRTVHVVAQSKKRRHEECSSTSSIQTITSALERSGACGFLQKTYLMISTSDPDLATWSNDGRSVVIKDTKRFEKEEIPKYFDHDKFASFSRQLNFYGFKKNTNKSSLATKLSKGHVVFHNRLFVRDRIDLLEQIKRSTNNSHKINTQHVHEQSEMIVLKERVATLEMNNSKLEGEVTEMSEQLAALREQLNSFLNNSQNKKNHGLEYANANEQVGIGPADANAKHYWVDRVALPPHPMMKKSMAMDLQNIDLPLSPPASAGEASCIRSISSSLVEMLMGRSLTKDDAAAIAINGFNDHDGKNDVIP
jgi:hypothetical protein